jgi:hypothetical protein
MQALAILFCGFSIFSAFSISLMCFRREVYLQQAEACITGLISCLVLLSWALRMRCQCLNLELKAFFTEQG